MPCCTQRPVASICRFAQSGSVVSIEVGDLEAKPSVSSGSCRPVVSGAGDKPNGQAATPLRSVCGVTLKRCSGTSFVRHKSVRIERSISLSRERIFSSLAEDLARGLYELICTYEVRRGWLQCTRITSGDFAIRSNLSAYCRYPRPMSGFKATRRLLLSCAVRQKNEVSAIEPGVATKSTEKHPRGG